MSKLKLLYILNYLQTHSDEEHSVSTGEIISYLSSVGIPAERKSIYSDIESLILFGCDIIKEGTGRSFGYKLASREFETAELKLLVNAVEASKFLSAKKSAELIEKIGSLTSCHIASSLKREVYVKGRVKSMNESIYITVDVIHSAIANDSMITFHYMKYDLSKKQIERHGGKKYTVSPFSLVLDDENYYLVAFDPASKEIRHYRVDKLSGVALTGDRRIGKEIYAKINPALFTKQLFGMFGGESKRVTISFKSELLDVVIDRFGTDVPLIPTEDGFKIITEIKISPQFFGWLSSFGSSAKIEDPLEVRKEYSEHIKSILKES